MRASRHPATDATSAWLPRSPSPAHLGYQTSISPTVSPRCSCLQCRLTCTPGHLTPYQNVRQRASRASNMRQDIARNAHTAHNADAQNRRSGYLCRRIKDRHALHVMRHRKRVRDRLPGYGSPFSWTRNSHSPCLQQGQVSSRCCQRGGPSVGRIWGVSAPLGSARGEPAA